MIKINKIDIENYRSCLSTKISFRENLTAIIGPNGAGKSNILSSILLLSRLKNTRIYYKEKLKDALSKTKINLQFGLEKFDCLLVANVFYETDEDNLDDVFYFDIQFKIIKKGNRLKKIDANLLSYAQEFLYYRNMSDKHFLNNIPKKFHSEFYLSFLRCIKFIRNSSYYSATQFSDPSKCSVSLEIDKTRGIRRYSKRTHDKFLMDLYTLWKHNEKAFKIYLNTINENGIGLITNIKWNEYDLPNSTFEVKTGGVIKQIKREKQILIPTIEIDQVRLTPNQLSEGTFKTLALIFYILNDKSSLLLIEEPEVCVHHGLLESIVELIKMKSKEKQIIVSTHSDYVLDKLKPENVVLVFKDKSEGTTAIEVDKYLSRDDYKGLKDYLQNYGNLGDFWKEGGFDYE